MILKGQLENSRTRAQVWSIIILNYAPNQDNFRAVKGKAENFKVQQYFSITAGDPECGENGEMLDLAIG